MYSHILEVLWEFLTICDHLVIVNEFYCRFSSDMGHLRSKDSGDQREASAIRDEVCQLHQFGYACKCMLAWQRIEYLLQVFYLDT